MSQGLWLDPLYRETVVVVLGFLFVTAIVLYSLQRRSGKFKGAWASLKSWIVAAPLLLGTFGLPHPFPLIFLVITAIFAAKTFFRMVGTYHRSWFVWTTYAFIMTLGVLIHYQQNVLYDLMPMLFLGCLSCIPLLRNSATHMIQYIALSLMCYIFFGWAFLHMGRLLLLEHGIYIVIYLYILVEFAESVSVGVSRSFGRIKLFEKITSRITIEGVFISILLTLVLAWGLRHMLPFRTEKYWVASALIASLWGRSGDLFLSVIRKDLGIKESGVFIIGRDDILARVDKLVFAAPLYYYAFMILERIPLP